MSNEPVLFFLMLALILVVPVLVVWVVVRHIRGAAFMAMEARPFPDKDVLFQDNGANCFGVKSEGALQIRGNGILCLSPDLLWFRMWLPDREVTVPVSAILETGQRTSFLGKTKGLPLLWVRFVNEEGEEDEAAWLVRDVAGLQRTLEQARDAMPIQPPTAKPAVPREEPTE